MNILVLNSGSSSLKFTLFDVPASAAAPRTLCEGELSGIGTPDATLDFTPPGPQAVQTQTSANAASSSDAIHLVVDELLKPGLPPIEALGYRVVHPGPRLTDHQKITPAVLHELEAATAFAPLHDPAVVALIREAMARFPHVDHFACFDTIFHQTMPAEATTYPIPQAIRGQGVRRYGFHGLSCESVVYQLRAAPGLPFPQRIIIAHLGSGCSVTALLEGRSVDNSMGLTPTGGVVMGTRPGDLDPGLLFYLLRQPGATVDSVEQMLNHDAGLKALANTGDMRKLRASESTDPTARLALQIFVQSVRKVIGGFTAIHGIDALVFTGGIGEHDAKTRLQIGSGLFNQQPALAPAANQSPLKGLRRISVEDASIAVYVVPAQEDLIIALHVARMAAGPRT